MYDSDTLLVLIVIHCVILETLSTHCVILGTLSTHCVILETLSIHYVVQLTLIVILINYCNIPVPGYNKSHCVWWITCFLSNDEITFEFWSVLSLVFNLPGSNSLSNVSLTTDGATLSKR